MKVLDCKPRKGFVKLRVESLDDLWYLSQVVFEGDLIKSLSVRRIKEKDDMLRSGGGERKTVTLTVKVEKKEFKSDADTLRLSGSITEGPEDMVSVGSHHTINVSADSVLTIIKESWRQTDLDRIREAEKSTLRPKFLVVVIDVGEACIGLVRESKIQYFELNRSVGGKYATQERGKRAGEFYLELADFIRQLSAKENVKNLVLAGAGFEKDNFAKYFAEANPDGEISFAVENIGSHGRRGVAEVLKRSSVDKMLSQLNSARDIQYMEEVLEKIGKGEGLAAYGMSEIGRASSFGAVEKLLVSDELFLGERDKIEPVMAEVKKGSGLVHIINHDSEAGQQLDSLGGIAATLRYKMQ